MSIKSTRSSPKGQNQPNSRQSDPRPHSINRGKWNEEENRIFDRVYHSQRVLDWNQITRAIGTRTNAQVRSHAQKVLNKRALEELKIKEQNSIIKVENTAYCTRRAAKKQQITPPDLQIKEQKSERQNQEMIEENDPNPVEVNSNQPTYRERLLYGRRLPKIRVRYTKGKELSEGKKYIFKIKNYKDMIDVYPFELKEMEHITQKIQLPQNDQIFNERVSPANKRIHKGNVFKEYLQELQEM